MDRLNFISKKAKQLQKNQQDCERRIRHYSSLPKAELLKKFAASEDGLTSKDVEKRQDKYGENVIVTSRRNTIVTRLAEATINPFNAVLLIIAAVSYMTDVLSGSDPDYMTIIIILSLIFLSSAVAFIQSQRSSAAAEKLSLMIANSAGAYRDGQLIEIPMSEIVPGDIVRLSSGDMIPADIRFLTTKDTFIAQAALTGESNPVEKFAHGQSKPDDAVTDLKNIGFMGSNVVSGSATAVVLATGNHTYFGSMAEGLSSNRAKNSFERGVGAVSVLLIRMVLVMVPLVFLTNGLIKGDWIDSLLFSVSIAVGLTPEMLPVIMTSTLATGAVLMSKHEVIVKSLGSIQTFGEMDILCTDKTGTLTEDKIVLEKYIDPRGEDNMHVFEYAYLNSFFQTGLKGLIDVAIIARAEKDGLVDVASDYTIVDEIPFDFTRRCMSVVLEDKKGSRRLITKGAVEEIMAMSSHVEIDGKVVVMSDKHRELAMKTYNKYNSEGLRVLAVAEKDKVPDGNTFSVADEEDMTLIGFVGFLDPPKESAKVAIASLRAHGVRTVVLTGDSEGVAVKVCEKVGVNTSHLLTGKDVENMDDDALISAIKTCDLFSKLSPSQKERVVRAFQDAGHTVGYMGDGINDAPPLHQADVGISVDSAVDIAKETANIILLKKDLTVLDTGVVEGRRTFGNIVKYIKMAVSGNFGNMISVMVASIFLPFLPMLPIQILAQNLLSDFSQMGIPFDSVDDEYLKKPRKWDTKSIVTFMLFMGPLSSVFDVLCFAVMWWIIGASTTELSPLFQCGWFVFGTLSQVLVIHIIRTVKMPFIGSRPSLPLLISTFIVAIVAATIGFSQLAIGLSMTMLPVVFVPWLALILVGYLVSAQYIKRFYTRYVGEWL